MKWVICTAMVQDAERARPERRAAKRRGRRTLIERIQVRELGGRERKVEDVRVRGDARPARALRDRDEALLDGVAEEDLRGRLAVLFRERRDRGVREAQPAH
jgi:ribosomal protein S8E